MVWGAIKTNFLVISSGIIYKQTMWKNLLYLRSHTALLSLDNCLIQQTRNTFILKRRWPPGLHKKNQVPHPLKAKNFVYDLVEDTSVTKKSNLNLILTSYVEGIGSKGDQVSMKPRIAYNKLLLPRLAVYATPENIEKHARKDENTDDVVEHSSPFAQRTISCLSRLTLAVVMNKETPWTIEPWHIRASLRKSGYHCVDEAITLPEEPITGPNLSIQGKEFYVTITINNLEKVDVKCRIHHWSSVPSERLPHVHEHWKLPAESVFDVINNNNNNTKQNTDMKTDV